MAVALVRHALWWGVGWGVELTGARDYTVTAVARLMVMADRRCTGYVAAAVANGSSDSSSKGLGTVSVVMSPAECLLMPRQLDEVRTL